MHPISAFVCYKLGRFYQFPTMFHLSDLVLMVSSVLTIRWITNDVEVNLM